MRSFVSIAFVLLSVLVCTGQDRHFDYSVLYVGQVRASGSYLGVVVINLPPDQQQQGGVQITALEEGSPAVEAGLKPGDILVTYSGEKIVTPEQLGRLVRNTPPQRRVRVEFMRRDKILSAMVVLQSADSEPARRLQAQRNMDGFVIPDMPSAVLVWRSALLGIECEPIGSQLAGYFGVDHGVLIRYVVRGSTAEKAGVKAGDVLLMVDGRPITDVRELTAMLRGDKNLSDGTDVHRPVAVTLVRNHKELTVKVILSEPLNGLWWNN